MDMDLLKRLLELGDSLWISGQEHEKKTALMLYQCGCNMKSPDAFVRLYQAKKTTKFKSKKYPNTARQDLFEAVKLNHVEAIVLAAKDQLFADYVIQFFYLKIAEKLSLSDRSPVREEISELLLKTLGGVPVFMQEKISSFVEDQEGELIADLPVPLCRSCKYLKRWDSEAPFCAVTASDITKFVEECKFHSALLVDPEYVDAVNFNMDESYNDPDDD